MRFAFIAKHRSVWPVSWLCQALDVSRSGFHAWLRRAPSARARADEELTAKVRTSFVSSSRTYGARRAWRDLLADGVSCGLHKIERVMRANALRARPRRRAFPKDAGQASSTPAANVLDRQFSAERPNQKWIADFTYIWTAEGWLYVAAVIDLFSRRVVGSLSAFAVQMPAGEGSMKAEMTAQLVADALMMAIWRRGKPDALLHHSDQGSQGGFKRSSQHLAEGGCDDSPKAPIPPFWTGAAVVTGTAASSGAFATPAILVGDFAGYDQRGCCAGGGYVAACRNQNVPKGGRHANSDVQIFGQAAIRTVSKLFGTRRDRASSHSRPVRAGHRTPSWPIRLDHLPRVATECGDAQRWAGISCIDSPMARRTIRSTSESRQACAEPGLARLCRGKAGRKGRSSRRSCRCWPRCPLERTPAWPKTGSAMGQGVEP
jgi:putative transposase